MYICSPIYVFIYFFFFFFLQFVKLLKLIFNKLVTFSIFEKSHILLPLGFFPLMHLTKNRSDKRFLFLLKVRKFLEILHVTVIIIYLFIITI